MMTDVERRWMWERIILGIVLLLLVGVLMFAPKIGSILQHQHSQWQHQMIIHNGELLHFRSCPQCGYVEEVEVKIE